LVQNIKANPQKQAWNRNKPFNLVKYEHFFRRWTPKNILRSSPGQKVESDLKAAFDGHSASGSAAVGDVATYNFLVTDSATAFTKEWVEIAKRATLNVGPCGTPFAWT
jgi:hypothetical protein